VGTTETPAISYLLFLAQGGDFLGGGGGLYCLQETSPLILLTELESRGFKADKGVSGVVGLKIAWVASIKDQSRGEWCARAPRRPSRGPIKSTFRKKKKESHRALGQGGVKGLVPH